MCKECRTSRVTLHQHPSLAGASHSVSHALLFGMQPVMDASIGGPYVDVEDELDQALRGNGPSMIFDDDEHSGKRTQSFDH